MLHWASAAIIFLKCRGESGRMPQQNRRGAPPAPRPRGIDEPGGDDGGAGVQSREWATSHNFAMHLLEASDDIRTAQELLGHGDVGTTMTDTHVLNTGGLGIRTPLDG